MDKRHQLQEAVKDFDEGNGKYSSDSVLKILSQLGVNGIYPGSVSKVIRKLNYEDAQNNSIDFQQLLEYYQSFQTESKHKIWKAKLDVRSTVASQVKAWSNPVQTSAAPGASPKEQQKPEQEKADLSIVIGPKAPNYSESIKFSVQKVPKAEKGKPFLKLQVTSTDNQTAKKIQSLIKQNFSAFAKTVGEQAPQLKDEFDKIHLNTVVANSVLSIFVTTSSDELIELINLYASFYDDIFDTTLKGNASLTYEFNFDFNKFLKDPQFTHYEALTKNCRFLLEGQCINVLKSLKRAIIKQKALLYSDQFIKFISILLLNSQRISGQIEFDNNDSQQKPETVTKSQIVELISELKSFIEGLEANGFKIVELLKIFGDNLSAELSVADWRAKVSLRLGSFLKLFTEEFTPVSPSEYEYYD